MLKIKNYLKGTKFKDYELSIASDDASFRRYFRLKKGNQIYIFMDSSLEKSSLKPFLDVSKRLSKQNISVPKIYLEDLENGYLVLEDFGSINLLDKLNKDTEKDFYKKAIDILVQMKDVDTNNLPLYDKEFLHFEMDLMKEWYIEKNLKITLNKEQEEVLKNSLDIISNEVLKQKQNCFVHRDFHSRNIMLKDDGELGVIDFQDAMSGALTYDLVSLLKDLYYKASNTKELVLYFRDKINLEISDQEILRYFDFMGLQRHIKVLGIFSRLSIRDKKDNYLKDIPLTLKYVLETSKKYDETKELYKLLVTISK